VSDYTAPSRYVHVRMCVIPTLTNDDSSSPTFCRVLPWWTINLIKSLDERNRLAEALNAPCNVMPKLIYSSETVVT